MHRYKKLNVLGMGYTLLLEGKLLSKRNDRHYAQ